MQKIGKVRYPNNEEYYVVWSENGLDTERIELISDLRDYNIIDTSNTVAAYYRKNRELYFGRDELIRDLIRAKNSAMLHNAKMEQSYETIPEGIKITQSKRDDNVGVAYSMVMVNGFIKSELYRANDIEYVVTEANPNVGANIVPITLNLYRTYDVVEDSMVNVFDNNAEYYSLEYLKAKYPLDHIENNDFVVVDSYDVAIERLNRWITSKNKLKAIDLETTGTEIYMYGKDCITGIVLSYDEHESTYYPFRQEKCSYNLPISFMQKIIDAVNNQPDDVLILAHNGKFEKQGVRKEYPAYIKYSDYACNFPGFELTEQPVNVDLRIDRDTYILSVLVYPRMVKDLHTLKARTFEVEGLFYLELQHIFKKEVRFNVLPPEIIKYYACPDAPNTIKVYKALIAKLPKDELNLYETIESPLVDVKACNEFFGMRIDKLRLAKLLDNEQYKLDYLKDIFCKIHKTVRNFNSPVVLGDIVYNKLRCPVTIRTKTGAPSTSRAAIKYIVNKGTLRNYDKDSIPPDIVDLQGKVVVKGESLKSNKYPGLVIYQAYKLAQKELGALTRIEKKTIIDRVTFGINQVGAQSGRQTSDAHQYSDAMKSLVLADSADHYLWSADFKQIELRILAYLAGQKDLIEMECDPDNDIHRATLALLKGKEMWEITADERSEGKRTNFGTVYGMTKYGMAQQSAGPAYTKEDLYKADKSITDFYNGFAYIKRFTKANEDFIRKNGFIKTAMGRYRYAPEILEPTITEKAAAKIIKQLCNTPVQGFGADYLKYVENLLNRYIKERGWDELVDCDGVMLPKVRLMLPIHDEVLVSSHKSIPIVEIVTMFKQCMELKIQDAPPFFSGPAMVDNWAAGKEDKYEIPIRFRDDVVNAWLARKEILLHSDTYNLELSVDEVKSLQKKLTNLRKQFLTEKDFKERKLCVSEDTLNLCKNSLSNDVLRELVEHAISPRESKLTWEEKCKLAISRCLDESFNPYLEDLNAYRTERLSTYMNELIIKWKTPEEVAQHVRHPDLTHVLISAFITKDETKMWSHVECILEAVKRYMNKSSISITSLQEEDDSKSLKDYSELEEYIEVDSNGQAIIPEDLEVEDDIETIPNNLLDVDVDEITSYVFYTLNEAIVDLSDLDMEQAEEVNQRIGAMSQDDAPYRVLYVVKNRQGLLKSNLYIGYDESSINNIIEEVRGDC